MAAEDLDVDVPLGKDKKKRKLPALPVAMPQIVAGVLGISVIAVGAWTLLIDDPLGGEPIAVVATKLATPATSKDEAGAASTQKAAATVKAAEPAAAPPGSTTVTIIDGSSGKKQDVVIPGKGFVDPKGPKGAADGRLLEQTRHGNLPKVGADGTRPSAIYARPVKLPPGKSDAPRIALIVGGLGISASATAEAMDKLPAAVTFAFAPFSLDVENLAARARASDHEVLLQAPMEPFDYPDNDPGPQTLLTSLSADQNIDRLQSLMGRMQGYVGIASFMGARFTASETAMGPILRETAKRGLIFVDDGASPRSVAGQIAGSANLPFAKADLVIDATPAPAEIDRALARLEAIAKEKGSVVGYATALPATITRIAAWAKAAEARGMVLVPVSMVAVKPKSS